MPPSRAATILVGRRVVGVVVPVDGDVEVDALLPDSYGLVKSKPSAATLVKRGGVYPAAGRRRLYASLRSLLSGR